MGSHGFDFGSIFHVKVEKVEIYKILLETLESTRFYSNPFDSNTLEILFDMVWYDECYLNPFVILNTLTTLPPFRSTFLGADFVTL